MSLVIRNLSEQLVDLVRERVLSGRVPPESPVRQDLLAAELGISKIPLREALARLEQEGLLISHANRGFFVRPLSTEEAYEVYHLRLKLEPETMALAALNANEEERRAAQDVFATLYQVTDEGGYGVGSFNRAFHLALLAPSHRNLTVNILQRLHVLSERYVRKHLEPLGRDERANEEHREILDAWLARDVEKVLALTDAHTRATIDDLTQQLESPE
ncbi:MULTISPECIES: GntR family transcriptional regulator [Sphingobium]|uniref:DNA-binding GntR family transcriptional regulator n=1 Tax=Sphingobium lignivorans TaxID=2735886 RepID=A0ABR6NF14_9SPHN|nr:MULTISPECIES: GntR family transcriptional regulator [Sphingobium]MBB5985856.1 DNA-binding GntR family transcriptional regulator [Sphingobium lignivorans]BAK66486.1 putative GntR family transcriptional regulator [Sphingobium sp. SYK-6]